MDHVENETADLIASQLNGRLTRRQLATGVLAIPAISALIAACGSDDKSTTAGTEGPSDTGGEAATIVADTTETSAAGSSVAPTAGGNLIVAMDFPEARSTRSPCRTSGPTASSPSASSSCARSATTATSPPAWPSRVDRRTPTAASGRSSSARASSGRTAPTSPSADVAATMDRLVEAGNSGLKGVIDEGRGRHAGSRRRPCSRSSARTATSRTWCRSTTRSRSSRPWTTHVGHHARRRRPTAPARGSSTSSTRHRARRSRATTPGGAAQTPLDTHRVAVLRRRWGHGHRRCRPARSTRSCSSRSSAATRCSAIPNFNVARRPRAPTHRQIWMRCDNGQFADKRVRQALA